MNKSFAITKGAHQTAILVRTLDFSNERVKRLLESVNRPNTIKADIVQVPKETSLEAAMSLATTAGYVLVLSAATGSGANTSGLVNVGGNVADSDPDDPDTWDEVYDEDEEASMFDEPEF